MSNKKEGGDFLGGVPRACFSSHNPCGGAAGNREQLEKATTTAVGLGVVSAPVAAVSNVPRAAFDQEADDPRYDDNCGFRTMSKPTN